jgi:hypothetical protein
MRRIFLIMAALFFVAVETNYKNIKFNVHNEYTKIRFFGICER